MKGVGPRIAAIFANREVRTVKDLLYFFPRAYEDRTKVLKIADISKEGAEGGKVTLYLKITTARHIPIRRLGRSLFEARCTDGSDVMALKWFHIPKGMEARLKPGTEITVTGAVKFFQSMPEIVHPELTYGKPDELHSGRVVPVYSEIEGLPTRLLRKILWEAMGKYVNSLVEDLPMGFLEHHKLPTLSNAIRSIHFPENVVIEDLVGFDTPSHWRLIYEEFLKFEYLVLRQRLSIERERAKTFENAQEGAAVFERMLPFKLTNDQKKAVSEILDDLSRPHPMNRLIQGDVGSGKTAVALITAGFVLSQGCQAALMAPTEILAEQHHANTLGLFKGAINVALLTGSTPVSERSKILERLKNGEALLLIGTHALIEDAVVFKNLAYIMTDEQHRFGVEQRRALRDKGVVADEATGAKRFAHTLILTATPIPRTLALTAYGDLSVTSIQELPPGRTPIVTNIARTSAQRASAYERIRNELTKGHQAYFIFPLINESEAEGFEDLKSAVKEAENLAGNVFPEFKLGILHGQLKADEKTSVMDRFVKNEVQILVSTTVIEVGVDVPNATVMAIEHSERFGLSQLHQLRGRVGRGAAQSHCFLFAAWKSSEVSAQRLDVLEHTNDGFAIAEADLEIRGPGEFLGTRQAGTLPFKLANIVRDRAWLLKARDDAMALLKEDPELTKAENAPLRRYYEREGIIQAERLRTG